MRLRRLFYDNCLGRTAVGSFLYSAFLIGRDIAGNSFSDIVTHCKNVRDIISAEPSLVELKWVTGRNAGRFRFVEAELALRVRELEKAEAITQRMEAEIREAVPHVDRVLIHAEPAQRTHLHYAAPLADRDGALSGHFGEAPYFGWSRVRLADWALEEEQVLSNPFQHEEKAKGIKVAEWLVGHNVDVVLLKGGMQGKGPVYVFGDAGVEMRETAAATLREALEEARTLEGAAG